MCLFIVFYTDFASSTCPVPSATGGIISYSMKPCSSVFLCHPENVQLQLKNKSDITFLKNSVSKISKILS